MDTQGLAWLLEENEKACSELKSGKAQGMDKSSSVAEMGDRGHKTWAEKRGAAVPVWVPV